MAGELVKRLRTLTDDEVQFLVDSYGDDQSAMLWISVCRTYEFVNDLSESILCERYESGIPTYTKGAYEAFFEEQAALHEELERMTPAGRKKMRHQVFRMLVECDLVSEQGDITPIHPSPNFARVIDIDHRDDLDIFPGVTLR